MTQSKTLPLTRESVKAAHEVVKNHVHLTPVLTCSTLNDLASTPQRKEDLIGTPYEGQSPTRPKIKFFFKCENLQRIGAFKIRGASHVLSRLDEDELARGVITHSSGNHAQAIALAAQKFGTSAHVIMPQISVPTKIAATKGYGAKVYFSGSTSSEREAVMSKVRAETGATFIHPYENPNVILGQGTMALELEEQTAKLVSQDPDLSVRQVEVSKANGQSTLNGVGHGEAPPRPLSENYHLDAVIAPLGGGGMLAGIATALHPTSTRIYGAEPSHQGADDGRRGLHNTPPTRVPHVSSLTIADGLRSPVGELNWQFISDKSYVSDVFAVTDAQIKKAMRLVLERMKMVIEPSAVVGLAVALFDEEFRGIVERKGGETGWDIGVVFSGGNVGVDGFRELFQEE